MDAITRSLMLISRLKEDFSHSEKRVSVEVENRQSAIENSPSLKALDSYLKSREL